MFQIKQNEATAVRRRIPILLVDITDGFTPELAITAPTVNVSKNGATIAAGAGTFTEIGNGQYYYEFTAGEVDTLGWIALNLEKATVTRDYNAVVQVMAYDAMDTVRLGLTAIPNVAQGTVGSLPTGSASGQVTVATNNDKTGYALSGTQTFNVTGNITGNLSGSVGSVTGAVGSVTGNVGGSVASVTGAVGSVTGAVGSVTGNVGGNVTGSVGSLTATAVQNIWDDATSSLTVVGSVGKLVVDNLNATISSRSTLTDTQVWTSATRTLTAGTNIVLAKGTGITGFNDITTTQVWSEALPGTYTSGQAGFKLNAAGSAADPWSTALPGAYSAGSAGNIIGNMVASTWAAGTRTLTSGANIVLAKNTGITGFNDITALSVWDVLASTVSVVGSMGLQLKTNVDATVSSRMASFTYTAPLTASGTASAVWDALLASYAVNNTFGQRVLRSTTAQSTCAVTGSSHIAADIHELQPGVITAADFSANAIDANVLATSAVTEIQTGLATSTAVSTVSTVTAKLDTAMQLDGAVYRFTANALELAPTGGGPGGSASVEVRPGPFQLKADNAESGDALDIVTGSVCSVQVQCTDANGTGVDLTSATVDAKVYSSTGTLVTTYSANLAYPVMGHILIPLTTTVTNTVGTYIVNAVATIGTTVTVYGPLKMYVRQN